MKRYIIIGSLFVLGILIILSMNIKSQVQDEKVKTFNKSIELEAESNIDSALAILLTDYKTNEKNYLFNIRLGWLYYSKGDYFKSVEYYNKALTIQPGNIECRLGITLPLSKLEEWDQIKEQYQKVLEIDPVNYTANLRLGQNYLAASEYKNAKKYLVIANRLYPSSYEPNLSLGWAYYYLGENNKAKELLTNALMLNENDSLAVQGLELLK